MCVCMCTCVYVCVLCTCVYVFMCTCVYRYVLPNKNKEIRSSGLKRTYTNINLTVGLIVDLKLITITLYLCRSLLSGRDVHYFEVLSL